VQNETHRRTNDAPMPSCGDPIKTPRQFVEAFVLIRIVSDATAKIHVRIFHDSADWWMTTTNNPLHIRAPFVLVKSAAETCQCR
jgi:hypothetical protein